MSLIETLVTAISFATIISYLQKMKIKANGIFKLVKRGFGNMCVLGVHLSILCLFQAHKNAGSDVSPQQRTEVATLCWLAGPFAYLRSGDIRALVD
jgi:hypothetical protein